MDLESIRELARDLDFSLAGIDATITRPWEDDVAGRIVWRRSLTEDAPFGTGYTRAGPRRVLAIARNGFDAIPRGTVVIAAEKFEAATTRWQVDGVLEVTRGYFVVTVVPETKV